MNLRTMIAKFLMVWVALLAGVVEAALPEKVALAGKFQEAHPVSLLRGGKAEFLLMGKLPGGVDPRFSKLEGEAASDAFRAEVPVRGEFAYQVQAIVAVEAVKKGEVIFARLWARAPQARQESGEGAVGFCFQQAHAPHERVHFAQLAPSAEWRLYEIPFQSDRDFAAGEAVVSLNMGELAQTVEVGGFELWSFGERVKVADLPQLKVSYRGREEGAAWREAALKRIEALRTAALRVEVKGEDGKPVRGVSVEMELVRPAFWWGTAVNPSLLVGDRPEGERYRKVLKENFNATVIENGLKLQGWENPGVRESALAAVAWMQKEGFYQRGHNLVWGAWRYTPGEMRELAKRDAPAFARRVDESVRERVVALRGKVSAWDVINEPLHEQDFRDFLPADAEARYFKLARELDPAAKLFVNEYAMLSGPISPGTIGRYREWIRRVRDAGGPIDAVGVQGHIGSQPRGPMEVLADLDLLAAEKLPVQITEFDFSTMDEVLQADYTRDFLIACYSHPAVSGFMNWGFWEGSHWKPEAAYFRKDWSPKPNAEVWKEWVLQRWKTRLHEKTDEGGVASGRGHFGTYRIRVTGRDGSVETREVELAKEGRVVSIRL